MRARIAAATAVLCALLSSDAFAAGVIMYTSYSSRSAGGMYCWAIETHNAFNYEDALRNIATRCTPSDERTCQVALQYQNTCVAVADTDYCERNISTGATEESAKFAALEACRTGRHADTCKIATSACDTFGTVGAPGWLKNLYWVPSSWDILKSAARDALKEPLTWELVSLFLLSTLIIVLFVHSRRRELSNPPPLPPIGLSDPEFATAPRASEPRIDDHIARVREMSPAELPTPLPSASPPNLPAIIPAPEPEPPPRIIDTAAAIRALKLASAYFEEASAAMDNLSDELAVKNIQTTLSLAAKQLDKAATADPNAVLETEEGGYTQERLRAMVLMKEALTWQAMDKSSKAIGVATEATRADPTCATAWYTQGALHFEQRNRQEAVSALEKAIELDPDFLDAVMLHDRATNLGDAEILAYKAAHARDTTLFAVAKTVQTSKKLRTYALIGYACFVGIAIFFTDPSKGVGATFFPFVVFPFFAYVAVKVLFSYLKDWFHG